MKQQPTMDDLIKWLDKYIKSIDDDETVYYLSLIAFKLIDMKKIVS